MLLEFYERFRAIQTRIPACDLCGFKDHQQRYLARRGIDLYSPNQREVYRSNKGFVKQAQRLEAVANADDRIPRCRWCERLGDSIIALHAPENSMLVTADKAFEAFSQILGREVRMLPSLVRLKKHDRERQSN